MNEGKQILEFSNPSVLSKRLMTIISEELKRLITDSPAFCASFQDQEALGLMRHTQEETKQDPMEVDEVSAFQTFTEEQIREVEEKKAEAARIKKQSEA